MECWFIWNARLSFWEAEFCCLLFTVLKILSSHQWPAAEKLRCREGRWNEILGPQQKRVTLQSSLTVCCVNFYFKIFSVSPDWFLSPLLSCPLKIKDRQAASVFKIPFANLFSKLETKIASHDCKEGMWLWNGMFHYSERGTRKLFTLLNAKFPWPQGSTRIYCHSSGNWFIFLHLLYFPIYLILVTIDTRSGDWQLELDHLLTVSPRRQKRK